MLLRHLGAVLCASALACATCSAGAAPMIYTYKGNGAKTKLIQTETMLGRKVDGVLDFVDFTTPDHFSTSAAYTIQSWRHAGYKLALGIGLAFKSGGSLTAVAAGKLDGKYARVAELLVQDGFPDARIRLGWEMNGGWYPWAAHGHEAAFIAAYRHVVSVMQAYPGARFTFVWNPSIGTQQGNADTMYPGDDVVGEVGVDLYCNTWEHGSVANGVAVEPASSAAINAGVWGGQHAAAFAKAHGKPYSSPEWGTGTRPDKHGCGDDPTWIVTVSHWLSGAAWGGIWDYNASDYQASLSGSTVHQGRPASMIAFMAAFGSASAGATSSVTLERNAGTILMAHAAAFATRTLGVTATGCMAVPLQTAPGQYHVILSSPVTSTCRVTWGAAKAADLYDPGIGTTTVETLGPAADGELPLKAGSPLILEIKK